MTHESDTWTCGNCTAINPRASRSCWNCKTSRLVSSEQKSIYAASEDTRSFRELLLLYIGEVVEANFQDPTKMAVAVLAEVHSDYFTLVEVAQSKKLHYPIAQVLSAAELPSTAATGKATLVIEVHRQDFPKGSIGFGFSFPI